MPDFACFIDTNYIESRAFGFDDVTYKKLRILALNDSVEVLSPDLIIKEVGNRANERFEDAKTPFEKALKNSYTFESTSPELHAMFHELGQQVSAYDPRQLASDQLSEYMESCNATQLGTDDIRTDLLFNSYFDIQPPFGKGKKRKEFVDAGVVDLLDQYHARTALRVHVISRDGDYADCARTRDWLEIHESLADMLDTILDENGQAELLARRPVEDHWADIIQYIERTMAVEISLHVDDYEGHVDLLNLSITEQGDKRFVALDDNEIGVIIDVTLNARCYVSMADPDLTAWDKGPIVLAHRTGEINRELMATLQLEFDAEDFENEIYDPNHIHVDLDSHIIEVDPYELDEDPTFYQ